MRGFAAIAQHDDHDYCSNRDSNQREKQYGQPPSPSRAAMRTAWSRRVAVPGFGHSSIIADRGVKLRLRSRDDALTVPAADWTGGAAAA